MSFSPPLMAGALAVRWLAAGARSSEWDALEWAGIALLPVATWLAAGSLGIVAPAWAAAAAAAAAVAVVAAPADDRWVYGVDAGLVLAVALTSVPAVPPVHAVLAAAGTVAAWLLVDRVVELSGAAGRWGAVAAAAVVALTCAELVQRAGNEYLYSLGEAAPGLALVPPCGGERVEVGDGSVAWLDRPRGAPPHPTALLLHGAHPRGSRQPAACAVRRALLDRGYAVLALDHVGYGASARPDSAAPLEAWDPVRPALAALARIREAPDLGARLIVGHSMGTVDAIRVVGTDPEGIEAVVLIGAAVEDGEPDEERWYRRFHEDRGLDYRLPTERWREIERRYYSGDRALGRMGPGHPDVVFVDAGLEWEHLLEGRDEFYRRLPGEKTRERLEGGSHYLNTFFHRGVMVTDAEVLRRMAEVLPPPR